MLTSYNLFRYGKHFQRVVRLGHRPLLDVTASPDRSPRASPRASPRTSPRASPRTSPRASPAPPNTSLDAGTYFEYIIYLIEVTSEHFGAANLPIYPFIGHGNGLF